MRGNEGKSSACVDSGRFPPAIRQSFKYSSSSRYTQTPRSQSRYFPVLMARPTIFGSEPSQGVMRMQSPGGLWTG
jgi:hypothetical protein